MWPEDESLVDHFENCRCFNDHLQTKSFKSTGRSLALLDGARSWPGRQDYVHRYLHSVHNDPVLVQIPLRRSVVICVRLSATALVIGLRLTSHFVNAFTLRYALTH